jgi:hypothetical protein
MNFITTNIKITFCFSCLVMFLLTSCDKHNKGEWIITDVSKDVLLTAETNVKMPTTLILQISGYANDSVEVRSMRLPGGRINEEFKLDHYSSDISVQFRSYKAKKGNLKIKYYLP